MYKIYFNNNFVLFLAPEHELPLGVEPMEFDITKVLQKVENNKNIAIICDNYYKKFEEFSSFFEYRIAAGGLVRDCNGKVLMIKRSGVWDLPKGHLERGETIAECAIREVEEECGITGLVLGDFLTVTYHVYPLKGRLVLKASYWFLMTASSLKGFTPQINEGITKVKLLNNKEITKKYDKTFASIKDVLGFVL